MPGVSNKATHEGLPC